jgi:hypothetical protein
MNIYEEFLNFLQEKNITLESKWFSKTWKYKEIKFKPEEVIDSHVSVGLRIKFFYPEPIKLGMFLKAGLGSFSPLLYNEGAPLFSKKLNLQIPWITAKARKKELAEKIFEDERIKKSLNQFKELLNLKEKNFFENIIMMSSGLVIMDNALIIVISDETKIDFQKLLDEVYSFYITLHTVWQEYSMYF